jgi:hypothetical protein
VPSLIGQRRFLRPGHPGWRPETNAQGGGRVSLLFEFFGGRPEARRVPPVRHPHPFQPRQAGRKKAQEVDGADGDATRERALETGSKARHTADENQPDALELIGPPGRSGYRRLLPLILRQWRKLVLILSLTAASSMAAALQPLPLKLLVDYALGSTPAPPELVSALATLSLEATRTVLIFAAAISSIVIFTLNSAIGAGLIMAWSSAGQRMVRDLAGALFHRLQRLSLGFHARRNVGDLLSRITDDTCASTGWPTGC